MRSNELLVKREQEDFSGILEEAEKTGRYNELSDKQTLRLRLLAEEMICMMQKLVNYGEGRFWIESVGERYELHLAVTVDNAADIDRERVISVSSDGKNAAARGIIGKICAAVDIMVNSSILISESAAVRSHYNMGMTHYGAGDLRWSLDTYRSCVEDMPDELAEADEDRDELERSIIANIADDVTVGIRGDRVEITIFKSF